MWAKVDIGAMIKSIGKYFLIALIGALLGRFVFPGVLDTIENAILGTPDITVTINELHPLEEGQYENFAILFGTSNGTGEILAAENGPMVQANLVDVLVPFELGVNDNTLMYFIAVKNNGNRTAVDVIVTLKGDNLTTDGNRDIDEHIDYVYVGGPGDESIGDIRKNKLAPGKKISLLAKARTPSIEDVTVKANGNYNYHINFRQFWAKIVKVGQDYRIALNGKEIAALPPINMNSNFRIYVFYPEENAWITTSFRIKILDSKGNEIEISPLIRTALEELGDEIEARFMAGADFEQVTQKMLRVLAENGFDSSKLSSRIEYVDDGSSKKLETITIYYLD